MGDCKKKHLTGSAIWRKEEVEEDRNELWEEDQILFLRRNDPSCKLPIEICSRDFYSMGMAKPLKQFEDFFLYS